MFKYRYTGKGVMSFWVDGIHHTVGSKELGDKRLKDEIELEKKVKIDGLELMESGEMKKIKKTKED